MIRTLVTTAAIITGFAISGIPANAAKDYDKCHRAWHDRNAVYAARNYCFKTAKAKNWFGANASNCKTKPKLSGNDWSRIKDAKRREKKYC